MKTHNIKEANYWRISDFAKGNSSRTDLPSTKALLRLIEMKGHEIKAKNDTHGLNGLKAYQFSDNESIAIKVEKTFPNGAPMVIRTFTLTNLVKN